MAGDLLAVDGLYDIGKPGATRFRDLSLSRDLAVGGLIDITSAGQIKFPAVQNPSANVNTLDDYEEGTVTAGLTAGTSGTITLFAAWQTLAYTKKGREVTVSGAVVVESVSSPVGLLKLTGLPFTNGNGNDRYAGVAITGESLGASSTDVAARLGSFQTAVDIFTRYAAGVSTSDAADVVANTTFYISVTYFV